MPSARDARDWAAASGLRGVGDSPYTPFSGRDGDVPQALLPDEAKVDIRRAFENAGLARQPAHV